MRATDLYESDKNYFVELAKALTAKMEYLTFTLVGFNESGDKHSGYRVARYKVLDNESNDSIIIQLIHNWKNDGTPNKPVTSIDVHTPWDIEKVRYGRYGIWWYDTASYAEDLLTDDLKMTINTAFEEIS